MPERGRVAHQGWREKPHEERPRVACGAAQLSWSAPGSGVSGSLDVTGQGAWGEGPSLKALTPVTVVPNIVFLPQFSCVISSLSYTALGHTF